MLQIIRELNQDYVIGARARGIKENIILLRHVLPRRARVKGGYTTRRRRKKVLKLAKGYFGAKHKLYKTAHEQVMHSMAYAYRDRRQTKRDMRKLWIARINAAARLNDISYSKLMHGLKLANVEINRKMLSEIAICDPKGFTQIVETAKKALEA